jgi:hypothetical protein
VAHFGGGAGPMGLHAASPGTAIDPAAQLVVGIVAVQPPWPSDAKPLPQWAAGTPGPTQLPSSARVSHAAQSAGVAAGEPLPHATSVNANPRTSEVRRTSARIRRSALGHANRLLERSAD